MLCVTAFDKGLLTATLEHIGFPMPEEYAMACLLSADPEENRHGRVEFSEEPPDPHQPVDPLAVAEKIRSMNLDRKRSLAQNGINSMGFVELLLTAMKNWNVNLIESGISMADVGSVDSLAERIARERNQ